MAYTQGLYFADNMVIDHGDGNRMVYEEVLYESTGTNLYICGIFF